MRIKRKKQARFNFSDEEDAALCALAARDGVSKVAKVRAWIREDAPEFFGNGRTLSAIVADALVGHDAGESEALTAALMLVVIALGLVAWGLSAQVLALRFLSPLLAAFGS